MSASHATDKDKELNHFLAIPWTRELLSQPGLTLIHPVRPRVLKESTEDQLFADVFSTPDTLKGVLTFHATPKENATMVEEVSTLFDLGYRLNGYPGVVHGGVVATIIDESMGIFLSRNQERGAFSNGVPQDTDNNPGDRAEDWVDIMTGELKVKFVRPVKSEQVVRVDVRLAKVEGRKFFVESVVKDEKGTVLARGEGLWIALKGKPKL